MMTTKKRRRFQHNLVVVAAVGSLLTACGPPGARELQQGEQNIEDGQFADAIVKLRDAALTLNHAPAPEQAKAWNLLGLAYQNDGQLDAAAKAYLQGLKLDRNNAAIDYNLGCLCCQQNDYPDAISYLTTYVTLHRRDAHGYLQRGTAYFRYAFQPGRKDERRLLKYAEDDFETAEKTSPSAESANALGVLRLQVRSPKGETIHAALADFAIALSRDPHCAAALLNLAIVNQRYLNNRRQALKLYEEYLAISPAPPHSKEVARVAHDVDLGLRISITPEPAPNRTPARTPAPASNPAPRPTVSPARITPAPTDVVAANPRPPPEQAPSAEPVVPTTSPEAAPVPTTRPAQAEPSPPPISTPPAVVQVQPTNVPVAGVAMSDSVPEPIVTDTNAAPRKTITQRLNPWHWFSGKGRSAESEPPPVKPGARYVYPPVITLIPGDRARAKSLVAEAIRARQAGDIDQCIRDYKDAIAADPTFYEGCYGLGLAAIEEKDYPTALDELNRALALQADSAEIRYAFAWTLQKRGYTEDAAHELVKLLAQHPADARAHLLLGSLYAEKLKQPKLAREQYIQAIALDPTNSQAANVRAWLQSN